tara:strand:+ start:143 stop:256 length:114 start_codon:yes stop_codon:yes gene_type:complete
MKTQEFKKRRASRHLGAMNLTGSEGENGGRQYEINAS